LHRMRTAWQAKPGEWGMHVPQTIVRP